MSRLDLDRIQAQLKVAIQSHQLLVLRMRNDPQNIELQNQLHILQAEITALSERQKTVVQELRRELVNKQMLPLTKTKKAVVSVERPVTAQFAVQMAPTDLCLKARLAAPNHNNSSSQAKSTQPPLAHQPILAREQNVSINLVKNGTSRRGASPLHAASATPQRPAPQRPAPQRPASPLIKVPQYSSQRATRTLVSAGGATRPASHAAPLPLGCRAMASPDMVAALKRSSLDKKHLSPADRKKFEFMASLDLVTLDILKELKMKRSERKRRSTANPQFSYGHFEPARKHGVVTYMTNVSHPGTRKPDCQPEIHVSSSADAHDDYCAACGENGELLMCDTCSLVYHLHCLEPPLVVIPQATWSCPKCDTLNKQTGIWPGTLALVHSYLVHRTVKEGEREKLVQEMEGLEKERTKLEADASSLTDTIIHQMKEKQDLLRANHGVQDSVDQLKNFITVFQSV